MTNNKEQYWKSWAYALNLEEQDFVVELKESLQRNFHIFQYWEPQQLTYTLLDMLTHGNFKKIKVEVVTRFIREFKDAPDLPAGIKLVDKIFESITNDKKGKPMTAVLIKPKQKPKPKNKKIGDKTVTPKLLITNAPHLSWIEKKSALWNAHVDWTVKGIWQTLFEERDRDQYIKEVGLVKDWNEPIQKEIVARFHEELDFVNNIMTQYPEDFIPYVMKQPLTLHQKIIGYYATKGGLIDLGDTGVGKTASALTAIALNNTKRNVILCPKSLINNNHWKNFIRNMFKDAVIFEMKDAVNNGFQFPKGKRCFYLLSYQTASRSAGKAVLNNLRKANIDYLILDEAQRVKVRTDDNLSRCRVRIENMLTKIRKDGKINILFLTATPVVNTVNEAKSLLQLVTGKKFKGITSRNTDFNLARMHVNMKEFSIRYDKVYPVDITEDDICCEANIQLSPHSKLLNDVGWLGMEQIALAEAKIPMLIEQIKNTPANEKIILFTKYVTGIVNPLEKTLEDNGISTTCFTGSRKEGLDEGLGAEFFNGSRVLIASSAVAEGIDQIQHHCNNVWFLVHGWTHTERKQVIGRIYRTGQTKPVRVLNFIAKINGYDYDQRVKIDRIDTKRLYHNSIVNGQLPDELIKGKTEKWSAVVKSLISGEKISGQKILGTGMIRVLKKKQRQMRK